MKTFALLMAKVQLVLAGISVILMMVNITLDVAGSKLFGIGAPSTLELVSYYYMIAVVFLPLAEIEMRREYLIVDLFVDIAPTWLWRCSEVLRTAATITALSFLAWLTLGSALKSYQTGELILSAHVIHIWPTRFILPVAFAAAALVAACELLAVLGQDARAGRPVEERG